MLVHQGCSSDSINMGYMLILRLFSNSTCRASHVGKMIKLEHHAFFLQNQRVTYNPVWWDRRLRVLLSTAGENEIIVRDSMSETNADQLKELAESKGLYL